MPTYKNLKYINESKNSILSNLDNNLQEQYASDLDQNLNELYNNEVRSKIEKMGDKNRQISEFLNEMYSNVDYNMDEFDPKYLKENKEKFKDIKGGIEATAALAESIGDESITAFTQNLNRVAGISGIGKHINNIVSAQNNKEVINRLGKAYTEKVKSGAIKLPKEKVMEHSNQKSLGANR